jgi:hypothetical protein
LGNDGIYRIDVLGGWSFSDVWSEVLALAQGSWQQAIQIYQSLVSTFDAMQAATCNAITSFSDRSDVTCFCGVVSLLDTFFSGTSGPIVEYTDCACNGLTTVNNICEDGVLSFSALAQAFFTFLDCASTQSATGIGIVIGQVVSAGNPVGAIVGGFIGQSPAGDGLVDAAVWGVQNAINQDSNSPLPLEAACACREVGVFSGETLANLFDDECACD